MYNPNNFVFITNLSVIWRKGRKRKGKGVGEKEKERKVVSFHLTWNKFVKNERWLEERERGGGGRVVN